MAKKITPAEAQSMASLFSQMRGDSVEAQANLEKLLATQESGTKRLEKQFKKMRVANIKEINKAKDAIKGLVKNWDSATEAEKKQLPVLNKRIREFERANVGTLKLAESTEEAKNQQGTLTTAWRSAIGPLQQYLSVTGLVQGAIEGLVSVYQNWWRLEGIQHQAIGEATMALGNTREQMQALVGTAVSMQGMFFDVAGEVDGIAITMQNATEVAGAMRQSLDQVSQDTVRSVAVMGRALAGGNENATILLRSLEAGIGGSQESLDEFGAHMLDFASDIGANAGQLTRDFIAVRDEVSRFGQDGMRVFEDVEMMATRFHLTGQQIINMMRGFDTFSQASRNVNQLNAMLGTTVSSYEMMMETNPAERLEMLRSQIAASGQSWETMGYHAQQAIAEMTGESVGNLAQVFNNGMSLDDMRASARAEAQERESRQGRVESAQVRMAHLFQQTSVTIRGWRDYLEQIWNRVSRSLTPIFNVLHRHAREIWDDLAGWAETLGGNDMSVAWIQDAANWIDEMITTVRAYPFDELWIKVQKTWASWQPTIQAVKDQILTMIDRVRSYDFEKLWHRIQQTWIDWRARIDDVTETITSWYNTAKPYIDGIGSAIQFAVGVVSALWTGFTGLIQGIPAFIAVWEGVNSAIEFFSNLDPVGIFNRMREAISAVVTVAQSLRDTFNEFEDSAINTVLAPFGVSHSAGGRSVPQPQEQGFFAGLVNTASSYLTTPDENTNPSGSPVPANVSRSEASSRSARTTGSSHTSVEFLNLPIVINMNGREFGRGQIEAALRTT